ncbi:response regulator [Methylobacterium sp. E-005]|uniref:response regulator n=1 Tax=Methylobacterium sp. E-005 TaxID=2836549 RepID=UPI001FBA6BD3|nr:response regulator [Methylobacterium sp. E-005]MCJ2084734.1 response regulator [Methylobacterium sp. E-005]
MLDAARPLGGRRILIVEDEYLIAMEVKRWLLAAGAEVVGPVPNVERALDVIADEGLDAAVLDVNLDHGDTVYPVADKLSALGVPYLFATGDVKISCADAYRQRPRLEKPFGEAELLQATAALVA